LVVVVSLPEEAVPEALVPKEGLLIAFVVSLAPELPDEPESARALPVFVGLLQADKTKPVAIKISNANFFMIKDF